MLGARLERNVKRRGSVPRRQIVEVRDVDCQVLFNQLVAECDAQGLETRTGEIIGGDAVGPDQENDVRNRGSAVGSIGRLNVKKLAGDGLDERARSRVDARREFQRGECRSMRLEIRAPVGAFDHDRPAPGAVRPPVRQHGEARPLACLRQRGLGGVALALQDVPFGVQGVGVVLEFLGLGS